MGRMGTSMAHRFCHLNPLHGNTEDLVPTRYCHMCMYYLHCSCSSVMQLLQANCKAVVHGLTNNSPYPTSQFNDLLGGLYEGFLQQFTIQNSRPRKFSLLTSRLDLHQNIHLTQRYIFGLPVQDRDHSLQRLSRCKPHLSPPMASINALIGLRQTREDYTTNARSYTRATRDSLHQLLMVLQRDRVSSPHASKKKPDTGPQIPSQPE
jgi:hypothetical protein